MREMGSQLTRTQQGRRWSASSRHTHGRDGRSISCEGSTQRTENEDYRWKSVSEMKGVGVVSGLSLGSASVERTSSRR